MILKQSDDKELQIQALESLLNIATGDKKAKVQKELNILRAGIMGEQETTYHIDFHLRDSENYAVIHDLRLEINGNVAQIDHILIHRHMRVYCIETKHFNAGIKINDDGEFMQWNGYKKVYEGIPSPLAQNQRHIRVLNEVFDNCISLPKLLGVELRPSFHSRVVVNNDARIERSKKFDSLPLVKSEYLYDSIKKDFENVGLGARLTSASRDDIDDIARQLMVLHQPIVIDYRAKFG
ncbi:MAG: nuclease-related domain-containing protein, partial [Methylophilus sp.]|nr:nuclease-related domain-containing protein [Methylophilus sp.]